MHDSLDGNGEGIDVLVVLPNLLLERDPVLHSQVAAKCIALRRMGFRTAILGAVRDTQAAERGVGKDLRSGGVEFMGVEYGSLGKNLLRTAWLLRKLLRQREVRFCYVRDLWAWLPVAAVGVSFVYDLRGDSVDELRARGGGPCKKILYRILIGRALWSARKVIAVSGPLAKLAEARYRVRPVAVIPSCISVDQTFVSDDRSWEARKELGISPEECVFTYAGGLQRYQKIPLMLEIWRHFLSDLRIKFIVLSHHSAERKLKSAQVEFGDRLCILSVSSKMMPWYLSACDIGFMLRDDRTLNRVASPVKFAEYLAAGLCVVGSPSTGDAGAVIESQDVGTLVPTEAPHTSIQSIRRLICRRLRDRDEDRRRAVEVAGKWYDWSAYESPLRELYTHG